MTAAETAQVEHAYCLLGVLAITLFGLRGGDLDEGLTQVNVRRIRDDAELALLTGEPMVTTRADLEVMTRALIGVRSALEAGHTFVLPRDLAEHTTLPQIERSLRQLLDELDRDTVRLVGVISA